jgi:DNA modification methylase
MKTLYRIHLDSASAMHAVGDESVDLIVTSPPYPMIAMWDEEFAAADPAVTAALNAGDGMAAFARMHRQLDVVWAECVRTVRPGGFVCINIGDATRTLAGVFRLYSNHARVTSACAALGLHSLPAVIWRKPTNAPTKFLGSGMLPAGAYVTLEHEYILIFRKGPKRAWSGRDAERRRASAFFWEERNAWFSDLWEFTGVRQTLETGMGCTRSAAFPFELAWRLIHMFSVQGDTVLDPFLGTGTTAAACLAAGRNCIGYERHTHLYTTIVTTLKRAAKNANRLLADRVEVHHKFIRSRVSRQGQSPAYTNHAHGFPVMTQQEVALQFLQLMRVRQTAVGEFAAEYIPAQLASCRTMTPTFALCGDQRQND